MDKKLKIFQMNQFDLWADYSLEEAKENYIEFCGVTEDDVSEAYEIDEKYYDTLVLKYGEDAPEEEKDELIPYSEYLKEFTEPGFFASSEI